MKNESLLQTESGMTLIETLVAMGVGLTAMLAMAQMMAYSAKTNKNISIGADYNNMTSLAALALANEQTCRSALGSLTLVPSGVAGNNATLQLAPPLESGGIISSPHRMSEGQKVLSQIGLISQGGMQFSDAMIQIPYVSGVPQAGQVVTNALGVSYMLYNAQLRVVAQKDKAINVGSATLSPKVIPFQIVTAPGTYKIHNCFGSQSSEFAMGGFNGMSPADMCKAMFPANSFVPGKGCIAGVGGAASCPFGQTLIGGDCKSVGAESGADGH